MFPLDATLHVDCPLRSDDHAVGHEEGELRVDERPHQRHPQHLLVAPPLLGVDPVQVVDQRLPRTHRLDGRVVPRLGQEEQEDGDQDAYQREEGHLQLPLPCPAMPGTVVLYESVQVS